MWAFISIFPSSVNVKSIVEYRPGKPSGYGSKPGILEPSRSPRRKPKESINRDRKKNRNKNKKPASLFSLPPVKI